MKNPLSFSCVSVFPTSVIGFVGVVAVAMFFVMFLTTFSTIFCIGSLAMAAETPPTPVPSSSVATAAKTEGSVANIPQKVNIEKEPWLCESANLPPSHPALQRPKMIWADPNAFKSVKEITGSDTIEVLRWVNDPPGDLTGKYVFIEVWATWCPPCRRALPLLNYFHDKYKDDLVVVSICETEEIAMMNMDGPMKMADIRCHLAVDTARRFANQLGVWGIPHAVIIEPTEGVIIWEGMPTQPGHELSAQKLERILAVGKKLKSEGKMPEKSPFSFEAKKPDPKVPNVRPTGPGSRTDDTGGPSFGPSFDPNETM